MIKAAPTMPKQNDIDAVILREIVTSLRKINYGEMVVTVHDSKVVQIETREKKRFALKGGLQNK